MIVDFPTWQIRDDAERAEDLLDLREILTRYQASFTCWQRKLSQLIDESGLSYLRIAEASGISRNTLRRWCHLGGAPRSRNTYLRLGFGLSLSVEQTNNLLVRYGGYPALYARDLFDAICIFLLNRGPCSYDTAESLYAQCVDGLCQTGDFLETVYAADRLKKFSSYAEFQQFISAHGELFQNPHNKLREYLSVRLKACGYDPVAEESISLHRLFAMNRIPARFEKDVSCLMVHGIVPRRERLIALGVYLDMSVDDLDEMLQLADMEPLCAKNRLECILIYALQQISLAHPELAVQQLIQLFAVTDQRELQAQYRALIDQYTAACFQSDPTVRGSAAEYLRSLLTDLSPEEAAELLPLF